MVDRVRTVAVISIGSMGAAVARVIASGGTRVVTSVEDRSVYTRELAVAAGVERLQDLRAAVAESEALVSLVPPDGALDFARQVAAAMRDIGTAPVFIDGNSIAPSTLEQIAAVIGSAGGRSVDLSIIGPPPTVVAPGELSRPQFYVAAPGAEVLTPYREQGLDVRVIDGPLGSAKALKMCYAGVTKGVIALVVEMLLAGRRMGVSAELVTQMRDTQASVFGQVSRQAEGFAPKAYRWVGEMQQMELTFGPLGLPTGFFAAAAEVFARLAETPLGHPSDILPAEMTLDMILDKLEQGPLGQLSDRVPEGV